MDGMETLPKIQECRKCGESKPIGKFRARQCKTGLAVDNTCMSCRGRAEFSRLKLEMLEAFGHKCACCGETHPYFLTLEHINGVAPFFVGSYRYEKRKTEGRFASSTYMEYRRAKKENWDKEKYECLCINCNFAKGHFGQCPHRTGVTREQVVEKLKSLSVGIGYGYRKTRGEFKSGPDDRRIAGQFKKGPDARRPAEQVN